MFSLKHNHKWIIIWFEIWFDRGSIFCMSLFHTSDTLNQWSSCRRWRVDFYVSGCINDVRYDAEWLPMESYDNSKSNVARVVELEFAYTGCSSAVCASVNCPAPQFCFDIWREHQCRLVISVHTLLGMNPGFTHDDVVSTMTQCHCLNNEVSHLFYGNVKSANVWSYLFIATCYNVTWL